MADFAAGLSAAGNAVSKMAGELTLANQREEAEKAKILLADELAGRREATNREWQGGENEKTRTHQASEGLLNRQTQERTASISAGATLGAARLRAEVDRENMTPKEVRVAEWFEKATPEQKRAYQSAIMDAHRKPESIPDDIKMAEYWRNASPEQREALRDTLTIKAESKRVETLPSEVKTSEWLRNATPEQRAQYEAMKKGPPKPLTNSDRDDLLKRANPSLGLVRLFDTFKEGYAGYKVGGAGDLANAYGRNIGGGKELESQAQWWQDYQSFANIERNALFGAALTATEKAEWEKAMINPGMKPEQVRENLRRQKEIALGTTSRIANSLVSSGISQDAVEAAMGMKLGALPPPIAAPATEGATSPPPSPGKAAKPAPLPPAQSRVIGKTYETPTGPVIWMGNGWARPPTEDR